MPAILALSKRVAYAVRMTWRNVMLWTLASACLGAADPEDAALGTWRFLPAESKYESGPAPRESQRVWEKTADGALRFVHTGTGANGQPFRTEFTARLDGKRHPVKGGSRYDSVVLERIDARTVKQTFRQGETVTVMARRTISADGKKMTIVAMGTNPDGKPFRNLLVYARK